jgi:hypothetical protein
MPSDRALLRANELADTQKQRADEAERVLRRVGLSWHDFAQYDRCKPWVKKPWHRQYGRTSIVGGYVPSSKVSCPDGSTLDAVVKLVRRGNGLLLAHRSRLALDVYHA